MQVSPLPMIASIDAARPVFMIVMGLSLAIFTWRLAAGARDWPARLMVAGSLMLAFGYVIVLPAYAGKLIPALGEPHAASSTALGWHLVKLATMNLGWLLFGTGIALHAQIFPFPAPKEKAVQPSPRASTPLPAPHESAL
jgi:hypothetical protein